MCAGTAPTLEGRGGKCNQARGRIQSSHCSAISTFVLPEICFAWEPLGTASFTAQRAAKESAPGHDSVEAQGILKQFRRSY
jgi:hypothetical protein